MKIRKTLLCISSLLIAFLLINTFDYYVLLILTQLKAMAIIAATILFFSLVLIVINKKNWFRKKINIERTVYLLVIIISLIVLIIFIINGFFYIIEATIFLGIPILKIFILTIIINYFHEKIKHIERSNFYKPFLMSILPIFLLLFVYLPLASVYHVDFLSLNKLFIIGIAVTYYNLCATLFSNNKPLDLGIVLHDGKRILGKGKSVRGTIGGLLSSFFVCCVVSLRIIPWIIIGPCTMLGDILASFIKRRFKIDSGEQVLFLDQLDSIIVLLLIEKIFWVFGLSFDQHVILIIATLLVQIYGNICLFVVQKKNVLW